MADAPVSSLSISDAPPKNLHRAVSSGDQETVISFLNTCKEDVNRKDSKGCTPLLLAECLKDEASYDSMVRLLVENGADVNVCNDTPLHSAVFYGKQNLVELLLESGADNLLHIAAEKGNVGILGLLLADKRCGEVIDGQDGSGRTPAFVAAQHDHKTCLKMLIAAGADLSRANFAGETVMEIIFENMTRPVGFLMDVLDSSVVLEKVNDKNRYYVDFKLLAPGNGKGSRQMDVISSLLVAANDEEKTEILQHPLIELYLTHKWSRVCYFFYLWIFAYVVFVLSMSVYVTLLSGDFPENSKVMIAARSVLIISASCLLGHGILQCCLTHGNHFRKYEMWMNLACTTLSLIVAIAEDHAEDGTNIRNMPHWALHVTSIAILLSWTELMLLIGRLPTYGYYALMFSAVLQNVIKVLMAFLCLVVGFALSFSMEFYNYSEFRDPWRALVKTTVMMMGEFEYADLFAQSVGPAGATSRVLFLMFIILTSIVLMNLMVGLAVSDIQCLQMVSHARKLEKQADFLSQLEKVLTSKKFRGKYVPDFVKKLLLRNYVETRYELETSAKFRRSRKLSSRLIDSLVGIAKSHREKNDGDG